MRIARFVHSGSSNAPAGMAWGAVEGAANAPLENLTVAAIKDHPFGPITFTGDRWALGDVRLVAPILPSKVVAIGKNYSDHVQEMADVTGPADEAMPLEAVKTPIMFLKPSTSVVGSNDVIRLPPTSTRVDYEAELAVVIGRPAKDINRDEALNHIFGYTCANDVTARDQQQSDGQWSRAKGYDSFCPIGPWIETVLDPSDLRITARVNGELRQDGRTSAMIHDVAAIVAFASSVMTLLPGDVLLTGTPAGVGPIVAGDRVDVEIEGIGVLTNLVKAK